MQYTDTYISLCINTVAQVNTNIVNTTEFVHIGSKQHTPSMLHAYSFKCYM